MPHYDRICINCGNVFEIFRRMSDSSPVPCPKCKNETQNIILEAPTTFTRNIDHPDSPLDEIPGHEQKRKMADAVIRKTLKDMGKL
ncbi:MAG: zinc ribbon domain-containing protein [Dehalococcoidia bacterium]|nr:zinc ribbon domain-containing protein [Dehalococcoidia bacterium]